MKESGRSEHSETVVKKKSSSGCLIIKKKVASDSVGGAGRLFTDSSKKKKRRRPVESDSESSDYSSETIRQKVEDNGSVAAYKGSYLENREFETEKRVSNGLDVFEFDEYDGFEDSRIRKDADDGRYRWNSYRQSGNQMESGNNNYKSAMIASSSSRPAYGSTSRFEMEDDEFDLPLSVLSEKYRLSSNKPIRLQGKNGVLKVMMNKNKQVGGVSRTTYDHAKAVDQKEPYTRVVHKKKLNVSDKSSDKNKAGMKPSFYSNSKHAERPLEIKLKSHSKEEVANNKKPAANVSRVKGKEIKVKRGSGTEKQILREKIKNMLLAADWTIDYRPRRNRDYLDAVYINPAGTAYWSIIKAYDAFQKEEKDDSKEGGKFTPLPDEILGKLTRQTHKKIEREMKMKRKNEDNDDKEEKSRKISRCTLLVRGSDKGLNSGNDGFEPYSGKRTLLSWLVDSRVVDINERVEYMNPRKTRIMQKGWITKDGVHCGCCSKIVTVLKFEVHAGSKLRQPFQNIYLESGKSLLQCLIDAWNKQGELERKGFYSVDDDGDDPNDDTCGLCGDGGDLICCDGCPSTFHQSCLEIQMLPQGDWHCPNCCCKYCEIAAGGNCTEASLLMCCLCQKKYHESCRPGIDVKPIESSYLNLSFCGHNCHELYSELQKLVGVKHDLDAGFSWSLVHRSDLLTDASSVELSQRVECNSMLAVAMSVMDECFLPFTDRRSGINLIRNVVFNCGSNLSRLNYSGFFTAALERGDEVLCAASIRIHGTQLAEMPFIGTRHKYRRQGMCRRLLSSIESALSCLKVEKLIIPAVAEHMHTWTDVFGFHPLEESHKQELRCMNMVVFPGTDMLQKPLINPIPTQGNDKTVEVDDCAALLTKKPELIIYSDVKELSGKTATSTDSDSRESGVPLDDGCSVDASKETLPITSPVRDDDEIPCEPQLSVVSVDAHYNTNVKEESSVLQTGGNEDPAVHVPSSDDIVSSHSNTSNVEELGLGVQNGNNLHPVPEKLINVQDTNVKDDDDDDDDDVASEIPCEPQLLQLSVSVQEESSVQIVNENPAVHVPSSEDIVSSHSDVSNVEQLGVPNDNNLHPQKSSFSCVDAHIDVQNTDIVKDDVASEVPCDPQLTVSVDAHYDPTVNKESNVQMANEDPARDVVSS